MQEIFSFLEALHFHNTQSPPIWLMRQAGRYMPQYRAIKEKYDLVELFHSPERIAQITMMPIDLLQVDAAIIFSDILIALDGLGKKWSFKESIGPIIEEPICQLEEIKQLPDRSYSRFDFLKEAICHLKKNLKLPLIGFCGAPFTLASYLIEGGSSRDLKKTKLFMYREPEAFHLLLKKITSVLTELLHVQCQAGVDAIQIFDSWAEYLSYEEFKLFSLNYCRQLFESIAIPKIYFCRGSSVFVEAMAVSSANAISLDWQADLAQVRARLPTTALQGNLDPMVLLSDLNTIKQKTTKLLRSMQGDPGFIFNLGHGILPDTPLDHVKFLVETVKTYA